MEADIYLDLKPHIDMMVELEEVAAVELELAPTVDMELMGHLEPEEVEAEPPIIVIHITV